MIGHTRIFLVTDVVRQRTQNLWLVVVLSDVLEFETKLLQHIIKHVLLFSVSLRVNVE